MAIHCRKCVSCSGVLFILLLFFATVSAQTMPQEGLHDKTPGVHALTGATIFTAPGNQIVNGTIVIRDGLIEAVGKDITPPGDARIWDYSGAFIYPGLIDMYVKIPGEETDSPKDPVDANAHWSPRIHPQNKMTALQKIDKKFIEKAHQSGFTSAYVVPDDGIFRGSGAVITLREDADNFLILRDNVGQHLAFSYGNYAKLGYPNSLMGSIAMIRQTLYDAQWYRDALAAYRKNPAQQRPENNAALSALQSLITGQIPAVFEVGNDLNLLRAARLGSEFKLNMWLRGSGHEYRQIAKLKALNKPLIIPVDFPKDLNLQTIEDGLEVDLRTLQHWNLAPENPRILAENNIQFAFTRDGLDKKSDYFDQIRIAIKRGLPEKTALAALTTVPAQYLGISQQLGTIRKNALAHLIVTDKLLFEEKRQTIHCWVDGLPVELQDFPVIDPIGDWDMVMPGQKATLQITGTTTAPGAAVKQDDKTVKASHFSLENRHLTLAFRGDSLDIPGVIRLSATYTEDFLNGHGKFADGSYFEWSARRSAAKAAKKPEEKQPPQEIEKSDGNKYLGAYAIYGAAQSPGTVLVKNVTIWTSGPQGILDNSELLIKNGKIAAVGNNLKAPSEAMEIDASGKHITPGLIDAHSHSAISGSVNESARAVSAEVRIGDVVDPRDIAIYRELAGGLTTANLLHGSANPIGGQNAVIKLRWGMDSEAMKLKAAPGGIKFALGENVKQSNWGEKFTVRYPQTRMGVETLIRDRFLAAIDYRESWQTYRKQGRKNNLIPPRADLALEALVEILDGKRLIHSHSYRQDEILMLCRIAEEFGLTIATFQHVLEGYKIAEVLNEQQFGASTFSDWWAYKYEVVDAIPYNGALMHDVGVVVSFNSDSDELARRMNTEAAKAVKYGGVSPEEALKFVTINPARQLRIDQVTGSLEAGKDADFVIWSGNPLSTYSICEQTWIDGKLYFDRQQDIESRKDVEQERARLVQQYLSSKEAK